MSLSESQVERFSRQIILPEIGGRGQARLLRSSLWLAETAEPLAGAARYLAGAGVGRFVLPCAAPELAAAIVAHQPDAVVESGGDAHTAEVALGGAALPPAAAPFSVRGGSVGARAWVARGVREALICRSCAAAAPPDDVFAPTAVGLAAAEVALAALNHLLGIAADAAPVNVFDVATGLWRDSAGGTCVACDGALD